MDPLPLSIVIIAHNEAQNIRRCLDPLKNWAKEIVVIVNDCVDGTDKIAEKEYGAKVFTHEWQGFRDQKNLALAHATQPWVLSLDADERVSKELKKSIEFFLSRKHNYTGAGFPRKTWFCNRWIKHGDWYPDWSLRLFLREKGKWGGGCVHEKLELSGAIARLKGDLEHYSYPTLKTHVTKILRFAELFVQQKREQNIKLKKSRIAFVAPLRAGWTLLRGYIFRLGFLDGFGGVCVAIHSAFATFLKYVFWYEATLEEENNSKK